MASLEATNHDPLAAPGPRRQTSGQFETRGPFRHGRGQISALTLGRLRTLAGDQRKVAGQPQPFGSVRRTEQNGGRPRGLPAAILRLVPLVILFGIAGQPTMLCSSAGTETWRPHRAELVHRGEQRTVRRTEGRGRSSCPVPAGLGQPAGRQARHELEATPTHSARSPLRRDRTSPGCGREIAALAVQRHRR